MSRQRGRKPWERLWLFGLLSWNVAGCYTAFAYAPPQGLSSDRMAQVMAMPVRNARGMLSGSMQLDVYSYAAGCPDVTYRLSGRGYRGSVPLVRGEMQAIALPGDEVVLLKTDWKDGARRCSGALAFRPRSATTYLYGYVPPGPDDPSCGAFLKEVVDPRARSLQVVAVRNVRSVEIKHDLLQGQVAGDDICEMASIRSDEPRRPTIATTAAEGAPPTPGVASPGPAAPLTGPAMATSATASAAPGAPSAAPEAPAAGSGTGPAATPSPPPVNPPAGPVVDAEAPASGVRSPSSNLPSAGTKASYTPVRNPRISGYSIGVRFGFAGGGDTLVRAQLSDGTERTITAGGGGNIAADLRLTPLWIADTVGFGVGAELGWKGQEISATNGSVGMDRYPLIVTAHVMARVADYAYLVLAGGVEKDLGITLSGSGAGAIGGFVDFQSALGGIGSLAFAYALTPHLSFDGTVRVGILQYDLSDGNGGTGRASASYGGFTLGGSYQF